MIRVSARATPNSKPLYPRLYSLAGFQYCDLLLDQGRDAEVRERAAQTLEIAARNHGLLDVALNHLSLGRAYLLAAQRGNSSDLAQATAHLQQAVDGLRRAGMQEMLPFGLLPRAALHIHTRDFLAARHDLVDAFTLATRSGLRLHEADTHLGFARLALAEGHPAPAREHLAKARRIVDETGYHRRDGELVELQIKATEIVNTAPHESPLPNAPPEPVSPPPSAPEIRTTMPSLDQAAIHELHAAALSAGLIRSRDALLVGIHRELVASLDLAANPGAQILLDLGALNTVGDLLDGSVPLQIWLANAALMAGMRREAAVFTKYRVHKAAADPAPAAPDPVARTIPQDRLFDALANLLPGQFDTLVFKLGIPTAYLSGTTAPQATRTTEILRWAAQADRMADVQRLLAEVIGPGKQPR